MSPIRSTQRVTRNSVPINAPQHHRVLRSHKIDLPNPSIPQNALPTRVSKRRRRRARADPWTLYRSAAKKTPPRPRIPPPTHFTCRICAEEKPVTSFLAWISASWNIRGAAEEIPRPCVAHLCRNPRKKYIDPVCKACISSAMVSKMDMTGARTLSTGCLEPGCSTYWDLSFILKFLPLESLEAYNMGMLPVWKESVKIFTCVSESCGGIGILDPLIPGFPQIQCSECNLRQCATCNVPWHTEISCADHAAKHINEQMTTPEKDTLAFMQSKDGKRCPNCYIVIEKDGGCDSMYCTGCKTYFNWLSAASAVPGTTPAVMPQALYGAHIVCEMDAIKDGLAAAEATVA